MQVWWRKTHWFRRQSSEKADFTFFKDGDLKNEVTLKIRSRSPKSNQLFPSSQQSIYASLVKIHPLIQKICKETLFWTFQSANVTLKTRSRSPKSNVLFPSSQQCIYASLVKTHPMVQTITHRNSILDISKCQCDIKNKIKVTKI